LPLNLLVQDYSESFHEKNEDIDRNRIWAVMFAQIISVYTGSYQAYEAKGLGDGVPA
jgi:hypothetical protein